MMVNKHSTRAAQILVVEDELILAEHIRHNLIGLGYRVPDAVVSGADALRQAGALRPDLVLMDIKLPGEMDGIAAAAQIRARFDIPVIYLTAFSDNVILQRAKVTGPFGYVIKPVETRELHATVEMALYRHQLETKLKESERWLDTTLRSIGDAVIATAAHGRVVFMNPVAESLTGWTQSEAVGRDLTAVFHIVNVTTRETVENPVTRVLREGIVVGLANHTLLIHKDGTEIPIDDSAAPIRDDAGKITGVVLTFRDITARVRAAQERERFLRAEREQRLLAETLAEVTLALTSQTQLDVVLNEILHQVQRIVPFTSAHIVLLDDDVLRNAHGRGYAAGGTADFLSDLGHPLKDFPIDVAAVRSQKPLVIPETSDDARWVMLDETAWIQSYLAVPICLRDHVVGLLRLDSATPAAFSAADAARLLPLASAAAIAIENARLVQGLETAVAARTAEIMAEQEKSATILRSVGDAIMMFDHELRIQYINPAFSTLTGYTAAEILGQRVTAVGVIVGAAIQQSIVTALSEGKPWQGETPSQRRDGRTYDAALIISPLRDAAGNLTGYVSSHRDISQRKALERARFGFLDTVSHQFYTPVTTLKTYVYLLQKAEPEHRYLQAMETELEWLSQLLQDVLEMTALDSGKAVTVWESVSLPIMIENISRRYQDQAVAAGLTLMAEPLPPNLPVVSGDATRLSQALGEVVENAIVFTPSGGRVTLTVDAAADAGQTWVVVAVQDTGPGISPEEQSHVFDRFFRGHLAASGHTPGVGLGLSIAQEIARAHGGRVTVAAVWKHPRGKTGSTFKLWLPVNRAA